MSQALIQGKNILGKIHWALITGGKSLGMEQNEESEIVVRDNVTEVLMCVRAQRARSCRVE